MRSVSTQPTTSCWNVPVYTANLGVDFSLAMGGGERLLGQAYVGFIGKKYLTDDAAQLTTSPFQRLSAKVAYAWPSGWSAFTQATWYPGDRYSEFAINFADPVQLCDGYLHCAGARIHDPCRVLVQGSHLES